MSTILCSRSTSWTLVNPRIAMALLFILTVAPWIASASAQQKEKDSMNDSNTATTEAGSYAVELQELAPQPTAVIRFQIPPDQISGKLAEVLPAVYAFLAEHGIEPGTPFSRYHSFSADEIDMEAGAPVPEPITGSGDIIAGELPGGTVATTWHVGPYDQLAAAHNALSGWFAEQKKTPNGGPWETYVTDPGQEPDPSRWKTQVFQAIEE